jgi:UDP-N-acetylmuramoyl-tripeptide--D-alanyl-D-alanine ligase
LKPLWTKQELIKATDANDPTLKFLIENKSNVSGVSINDKTIKKGDIFVALKGHKFDGHDFIKSALNKGAAGIIVSDLDAAKKFNALHVTNTIEALIKIAKFARIRFQGKTIAITGSSGKTSTRFIAATTLRKYGATHSTQGNNNNLIGLSLTLSRLPSTSKYCVLELGMNHPGEIEELTKIALPNIALVTNVSNSHIENFKNERAIADAKSEIFLGLTGSSTAILNADNKWCQHLFHNAEKVNANVHFYGFNEKCKTKILKIEDNKDGTIVCFDNVKNWRLKYLNSFQATNAVAVISILRELKLDISNGMNTISEIKPLPGRGEKITLNFKNKNPSFIIDDSYNANPISMKAALVSFYKSKLNLQNYQTILIIGDMLELGTASRDMHSKLIPLIRKINRNFLITLGDETENISQQLKSDMKCISYTRVEMLLKDIENIIQPKQLILIKGSNGTGLWKLLKLIKNRVEIQGSNNAA